MRALLVLLPALAIATTPAAYFEQRDALISSARSKFLGDNLRLSANELRVDEKLRALKASLLAESTPLVARHFFDAKEDIERTSLFRLLRSMPKGAALHVHSDSMVDLHWMVRNATYDMNLYVCGNVFDGVVSFRYFSGATTMPCQDPAGWQNLPHLRAASENKTTFDSVIHAQLSLGSRPYSSLDAVWEKFNHCLGAADGIIFYDPFHTRYLTQAFESFKGDGVTHLELRQVFQAGISGTTYTLNGTVLPYEHLVAKVIRVAEEVGISVQIIVCVLRHSPASTIEAGIATTKHLMSKYPSCVVGFDLVGQEDPGYPLSNFVPQLLEARGRTPFYFHAGETDMVGGEADSNLYDAVLLNATRIGHGYGLARHQELSHIVKERGTAIEVCPLSNQVLLLVADLRNHPLAQFVSEGLPLTVSPDDPALWGADGVSYDWFQFFLASGNATGLGLLKQLAINSLAYSSLSVSPKADLTKRWEDSWKHWVVSAA